MAACVPACSHSWPSWAAIADSVPVQADRRSWSREASVSCNCACDWSSVPNRAAECRSKAAAAASRACWLSLASFAPTCSWRDCASVQAWVTLPAAVSRRLDTLSSRLACDCVCATTSRTAWASDSVISCWRATACSPACSHCRPSAAVMAASVPLQAASRSSSREASVACRPACDWSSARNSEAECCSKVAAAAASACWLSPASLAFAASWRERALSHCCDTPLAAASMRADTPSSRLAWTAACEVMSRTVCASVSAMPCWRSAAWAPACCHSWRSVAPMAPSVSVHAARRCWSREASSDCSAVWDWFRVRSSDAECCSKLAAAAVSACRLSPASFSLTCSWRASAWVHASDRVPDEVSRREETLSSRAAERCSKVWANRSSDARRSCASASLARCCPARAWFQMSATFAVEAWRPAVRPSNCRCTAWVTVSCKDAVSRDRPAIVASTTGCRASPAERALCATPSFMDCSMTDARRA
ncbi:hypothetical protein D9M72_192350 [compost metagenome]